MRGLRQLRASTLRSHVNVNVSSRSSSYLCGRRSFLHHLVYGSRMGNACSSGSKSGSVSSTSRSKKGVVKIMALDAAQPFDFESKKQKSERERGEENAAEAAIASTSSGEEKEKTGKASTKLKIGIVGFGTFGQFLARRMVSQGHQVMATSRSDKYNEIAKELGVEYYQSVDDFCEEHPEVVVLCTSILSTESVVSKFPFLRLKRDTLMVDVLSVKEFPKRLLLRTVPEEFDILCTHPMFGPDSGKGSWENLPLMYDQVRINERKGSKGTIKKKNKSRCENFLSIFEREGCRMIPMTCEEHDRQAASTQFITHTVGRMLGDMMLESTQINTKGYESLLTLIENTCNDSFELYYGLFMYNQNATETLEAMERSFDRTKKKLFDQLHEVLREQLFGENQPEHIQEQQRQQRQQQIRN
mmetsp:Transcript_12577/g.23682  ORF Transcript_12577/g.23682 Transcript_12577/m.23682 type:complete len:415 (+) Transcript_12577:25-1269(+)